MSNSSTSSTAAGPPSFDNDPYLNNVHNTASVIGLNNNTGLNNNIAVNDRSHTTGSVMNATAMRGGNNDMQQIEARMMDPTGKCITNAGKICGIIGTVLAIIGCGAQLLIFALDFSQM